MMRKTETAWSTLPSFAGFSPALRRAMAYLDSTGRTFRAEKVPLCFIEDFEWASTETRKIVKDEERMVYFLDHREKVHQVPGHFENTKLEACQKCDWNSICTGIYEYEKYYNFVEVTPKKVSKERFQQIVDKIKSEL